MNEVEVLDLGDATQETKQCAPIGPFADSHYGWGWCMGLAGETAQKVSKPA